MWAAYPLAGCIVRHFGLSIPWMTEVFRDPSSRATLICVSSFSELSQYIFLESQSTASPRQFWISAHVPEIAISTEVHITTNLMGDCNTSSHAVIKCLVCKGTWSACWSVWEGLRNTPCLITALKKIYISLHLALLLLFLMQFGKANPRRTSQTSSPIT